MSDPDTAPIIEAGCVKCQAWHRKGFDREYNDHMPWQAKHHYRERPPTLAEIVQRVMEKPNEGE